MRIITEERKEYMRNLQKQPHIIKTRTIKTWKKRGIIHDDYEALYEKYLNTSHCELCNVLLEGNGKTKKCCDHDHENGKFRNILCNNCNWVVMRNIKRHRIPIEERDENLRLRNEKRKEKYTCECGSIIGRTQKSKHEKTKKHLKFIEKIKIVE